MSVFALCLIRIAKPIQPVDRIYEINYQCIRYENIFHRLELKFVTKTKQARSNGSRN